MTIEFLVSEKDLVIATTSGLIKEINEDKINYERLENSIRICICDGHWGEIAAEMTNKMILQVKVFPNNKHEAVDLLEKIELELWKKLGKENMDAEKDLTSETSVVSIEIDSDNNLRIISYGDSRLMITNKEKIVFKLKLLKTWLGAFSFKKLRGRLLISKALQFKKIKRNKEDLIWMFTDGIDECLYEKETISTNDLLRFTKKDTNLKNIADNVFKEVEKFGAEDNASLALIRAI